MDCICAIFHSLSTSSKTLDENLNRFHTISANPVQKTHEKLQALYLLTLLHSTRRPTRLNVNSHTHSLPQAWPTFYSWNDVYSTRGLFEKGNDLTCNFILCIDWINDKFEQ